MKVTILLASVLGGCSPAKPLALPLPVVTRPAPDPAPSSAPPPSAVAITKAYKAVASQERARVTSPDATPDSVSNIDTADKVAQAAVRALLAQGRHPTKQMSDAARAAVRRLSDVLESSP